MGRRRNYRSQRDDVENLQSPTGHSRKGRIGRVARPRVCDVQAVESMVVALPDHDFTLRPPHPRICNPLTPVSAAALPSSLVASIPVVRPCPCPPVDARDRLSSLFRWQFVGNNRQGGPPNPRSQIRVAGHGAGTLNLILRK